jgi:hypothetical protein
MFTDPNFLQVSGLTISFLLLAILIIREFAHASSNPRWSRISFYLMIPILPLFVVFIIQAGSGFNPWDMPNEFREVDTLEIDLTTFSIGSPTPALFSPVIVTPTPLPPTATRPARKSYIQTVETAIPERNLAAPSVVNQQYCPIVYREYP